MVSQLSAPTKAEIIYPDNDGKPMANNTIQFCWILVIQQNLDWLLAENANAAEEAEQQLEKTEQQLEETEQQLEKERERTKTMSDLLNQYR